MRDRLRAHGGRVILNSEAIAGPPLRRPGRAARGERGRAHGRVPLGRARHRRRRDGRDRARLALAGAREGPRAAARRRIEPGAEALPPRYLDDHPFNAVGVAVDDRLRPVEPAAGGRLYENVLVAGATLAGARP